jgi:hypothetical protein
MHTAFQPEKWVQELLAERCAAVHDLYPHIEQGYEQEKTNDCGRRISNSPQFFVTFLQTKNIVVIHWIFQYIC